MPRPALAPLAAALLLAPVAAAQDHAGMNHAGMNHAGTGHGDPTVDGPRDMSEVPAPERNLSPPRVFLDKSPRVVAYQLNRLDDARLLMVERTADDPKYAPVHAAILARPGVSNKDRAAALDALVALNDSSPVVELLAALEPLTGRDAADRRAADKLTEMLLARPAGELKSASGVLAGATTADNRPARVAAFAALIETERFDELNPAAARDWLAAVPLVPSEGARNALREDVVGLLDANDVGTRTAAVGALAAIPAGRDETFRRLAPLLNDAELRPAVVRTLLTVPAEDRDPAVAADAADVLVAFAESIAPADRTTDDFLRAMQLADGLLGSLPAGDAGPLRDRLREVAVRVVVVKTVEEEMRYDKPYFAVEAGRPVQVLLENEDLMPHNLVVTLPGQLKFVAARGLEVGPAGSEGKAYVSNDPQVLFATDLVDANARERLTFTAPSEPGEYPYVCTFPRHWPRMYGVMVVVDDLDAWLRNPVPPKDPLGNDRTFVKNWQVADFVEPAERGDTDDIAGRLAGRSPETGLKIFTEAGCAQCHRVEGKDSLVGPSLVGVFGRWKDDPAVVLREILDPSAHVDPRYAVRTIFTDEGQVLNGLVTAEDDETVSILVDPAADKPTVIPRDAILDMAEADISMMPKALMDRFTEDEILELLAYLQSLEPADAPAGLAPSSVEDRSDRPPAGPRTEGTGAVSSAGPPNAWLAPDRPRNFRELKARLADRGVEVTVPKVEPAAGVRELPGLTFAERETGTLKLDLFLPADIETMGQAPPLAVLIHGGGWRRGDRGGERNRAVWLANRGFAAASVDYRLSGDAPFPAAIEDVRDAVRFLRDRAENHGYDDDRVAAVGSSAGAHLAALLATAADPAAGQDGADGGDAEELDLVSSDVQAAVVIAGPTDTEDDRAKNESRRPGDNNYRLFLGGSYDEVPAAYAAASPAHWANADTPPLLLVGEGTMDAFEGLTGKLEKLGVSYETFLLTGGIHAEWNWEPWFTPTMDRVETFLNDALAADDTPTR